MAKFIALLMLIAAVYLTSVFYISNAFAQADSPAGQNLTGNKGQTRFDRAGQNLAGNKGQTRFDRPGQNLAGNKGQTRFDRAGQNLLDNVEQNLIAEVWQTFVSKTAFFSNPATCPNMNGHFRHTQFGATADAFITQTGCDAMEILINADILGTKYNEDVQSPLDGVTRPAKPASANETDTVSGKWNGDVVVFVVDRFITDTSTGNVKHTTTQVAASLVTADKVHADSSDVDANGNLSNTKGYDFNRVP